MVLEGLGFDKRNDEKMYECAYRNFPIKLIRFEGNNVIFTVDPIADFTQLGRKNTYVNPFVAIDINDILNNSTANALRLSLAMMVMVTQSTDNKPFEFSATTKQLKDIFGLGRLDYCTISGEHKEFLKEYYPYHELYIKYGGFDLEHVDTKRIYQLRTKYGFSSNEEMENCFVNNMSDIHFDRYNFERYVLTPAIENINAGSTIKIIELQVIKRYGDISKEYFSKKYAKTGNQYNYRSVEGYHILFSLAN